MCGICGCAEEIQNDNLIHVEQSILAKNEQFALKNRKFFLEKKILALNIMSSPGSGKTTLLTKTITDLKDKMTAAVIVGDQQTDHDAIRIKSTGTSVVQVNTGKVCHLDAHMIEHALEKLSIHDQMTLFIENVGNLVCPALFSLGEHYKIVILSVTEGDNKPLKYPDIFYSADLMIVTKTDLLPYTEFSVEKCVEYAHKIKPDLEVMMLSTTQGHGLSHWYDWLIQKKL